MQADGAADRLRSLLVLLLEATNKEGVKAWAIQTALTYALGREPQANKRDVWKLIQSIYQSEVRRSFPDQEDPGQSFRRASGDAWEGFIQDYINSNPTLQKAGIRAVRLQGDDFSKYMRALGSGLRPKDVDMFLQGITADGSVLVFGALFPKASYAERIRADEGASRALMGKGLWSATITLDARDELGTEARPSVKRDTINKGAFHGCYSFNDQTTPGPKVHIVHCTERGMSNPLVRDIVQQWRTKSTSGS